MLTLKVGLKYFGLSFLKENSTAILMAAQFSAVQSYDVTEKVTFQLVNALMATAVSLQSYD